MVRNSNVRQYELTPAQRTIEELTRIRWQSENDRVLAAAVLTELRTVATDMTSATLSDVEIRLTRVIDRILKVQKEMRRRKRHTVYPAQVLLLARAARDDIHVRIKAIQKAGAGTINRSTRAEWIKHITD